MAASFGNTTAMEWASRILNMSLFRSFCHSFVPQVDSPGLPLQSNFGDQAEETLQQEITGGFGNIHKEFNDLFESSKIDKSAVSHIEADIDALKPTIYWFDINLEQKISDQSSKCSTAP